MKNILIKVPESTKLKDLPENIVQAIQSVNGQFAVVGLPVAGEKLLDCITSDAFDAALMLPPGWVLMGEWQWDGVVVSLIELTPLNADFINFMPDELVKDQEGNILYQGRPTAPYEVHKWAGWPDRF